MITQRWLFALVCFGMLMLPASSADQLFAQSLPLTLTGDLDGAAYAINVPANWNGTLIVFQHGYRDVADAPGETEDHTAHFDPVTLGTFLVSEGYATAASAFSVNGYNIKEGIDDTKALTSFFRDIVGAPARTVLFGRSGGGTMSAKLLETGHGLFDGAVSVCGVMAGTPLFFDRGLAFLVAYDAAFGFPVAWGTPGDVRNDLDFELDVLPVLLPQLVNPANHGRFEFIRLVSGLPAQGFYPGGLFANMLFNTEARAQLETKLGGPATQNLDHVYQLSTADIASLSAMGVDADALLDEMNAHAIYAAEPSARLYAEHWAAFDGDIKKPILTMHTEFDTLATVDNESVYHDAVQSAGREDLLVQVFTDGVGHCAFTQTQSVAAIQAMESWLNTGEKPDASFFPASQGFVPGFTPSAWPYPVH